MSAAVTVAVQGAGQVGQAAVPALAMVLAGLLGVALAALAALAWGRLARREPYTPGEVGEVGDDTIAMLCLCCNGARGGDCICTHDCGNPRCQAACPAHVEGCGPGRNMLAYPSLACPACDWIAGRLEDGGDGA